MRKLNIAIVGGSGYAGGELLRLLLFHPNVVINQVTSRKLASLPVAFSHPNLRKITQLSFIHPDKLLPCDLLFVALPNGESIHYMANFNKLASKIIDLGADFRLHNPEIYEQWYQQKHLAPQLLSKFVYGIVELHREEIKKTSYVACGGCEATVSILALYPLIKLNLIEKNIIIDAKMSSSQAGVKPSLSTHHPERAGVVRSYMPTGHRHTAEIEQELNFGRGKLNIAISATALDMVRGLLVTIHTIPKKNITEKNIWQAYRQIYKNESFIKIVKQKTGLYRYPEPKILQGTNYCDIGFEMDKITNRLVIIAAIDNLVKGTAGQAIQAMNVMCNFPETTGLEFPGLHPV